MYVAMTGAGGLVGSAVAAMLSDRGHKLTRLVRRQAREGEVTWDPAASAWDASALAGVEAVVHLAGENIASGRWTSAVKAKIRDSRVKGTRVLCEGLARMASPPRVLVVASAIGYYGSRGEELLDENSPPGTGFLAEVVRDWEAASQPAEAAGIRVVRLRIGVVLSPKGGALAKMLTPFKLGGGGIVGSGKQYFSWIALDDVAGAILYALESDVSGRVNCVAPGAVTNQEFTRVLGRVLNRPTVIPLPAFAVRLVLGEMGQELLLASTRVEPQRLLAAGYKFQYPTLEPALRHLLHKDT